MKNFFYLMTALVLILIISGCQKKLTSDKDTNINENPATNEILPNEKNSELKIEDIISGQGEEAKNGSLVTVNYLGTLTDGTKFDSSYDRKEPFQFLLGGGMVIRGWDLGVLGMKTGGKRKLVIPPDLAYGENAIGAIPPNSTLIFEVELLKIENK